MAERVVVHAGSYHDSAFLMRLSRELKALEGVADAVVVMATDMNHALLTGAGFAAGDLADAGPLDLVVALRGTEEAALDAAEAELDRLMQAGDTGSSGAQADRRYASIAAAAADHPAAGLVSVAVPGAYAGWVAGRALDAGRHVFLFSNNVPLEQELALKARARELGLLVMGPDCGTAWIAGCGLGFANRVGRGRVGLVGASGTGMQEIACLLDASGVGLSQGIGTGSRDLSAEVDGAMSQFGLELLAADPATEVLVLVAKPPADAVAERLHGVMAGLGKPVVVRYLGRSGEAPRDGVVYTGSLDEAACEAVAQLGGKVPEELDPSCLPLDEVEALLAGEPALAGRLVGLFGGGSLTTEAKLILTSAGLEVSEPEQPLGPDGPVEHAGHLVVDTGEDFYTVGKPHPMVDQTVRCGLLTKAAADPAVGVLLLDLVLGDGAHPDPAPELAAALDAGRSQRGETPLTVIASVTGTKADPQDTRRQADGLRRAGVLVKPSAAQAAHLAAALLKGGVA